jgi:hypothetical protein
VPIPAHSGHPVSVAETCDHNVGLFEDRVEEKDVEDGDEKPGNDDNEEAVKPKEIVNKDIGICKVTPFRSSNHHC